MSNYISQEAATVIAIVLGPILAVLVSKYTEYRRDKKRRKWRIYNELMKRRGEPIYKFSWALNLIHVEFSNKKKVIEAWENLYNDLGEAPPATGNTKKDIASAKKRKRIKRERLFAILLQEMSRALGHKVDHRFISDTVYDPIGNKNKRKLKEEMNEKIMLVLSGESPIAIKETSASSNKSIHSGKDTKNSKD